MSRMTSGETSGDKRKISGKKVNIGKMLARLWKYIGKYRFLVVLAVVLKHMFILV